MVKLFKRFFKFLNSKSFQYKNTKYYDIESYRIRKLLKELDEERNPNKKMSKLQGRRTYTRKIM